MRWRARYYWSALPLSVEQNDETTSQDLPYRLLLADAQNVRSVWHHQPNDQRLNPRRTAVRAQHAIQQSCLPGYRRQQITLRADRREVLLPPHRQLPRCPTVRLACSHVCGAWLVWCVRVAGACRGEVVPLAVWRRRW
jgi:hypothetical protein